MNISRPFVLRPVATTLLTLALLLAGVFAYVKLPVAPLPQVDFPTILVRAQQPGGSPDEVATSVAAPLERHLGQIAGVTEMTSQSVQGQVQIVVQFDFSRDVNGAAGDVQAAIQAARADLPTSLRTNPSYFKFNPANSPIMILTLTSATRTMPELFDYATNVLQQSLSSIRGVGRTEPGGSSLPAVRVEMNPLPLFKYGIGFEDVRAALASANADSPKGFIDQGPRRYQLDTNDQARRAADYRDLIIAYRNNSPVRLKDVSEITDSVEDLRNLGMYNGIPAVIVLIYPQADANVVKTTDQIKAMLPTLRAAMPGGVELHLAIDRSSTIRASLRDTQFTLAISVVLVILVVLVFLRTWRSTLIPAVAVPTSIISTFAAMYLLGFSLDNLSLMALTVATGFVVDDAIVVLENIARHMEAGMPRREAALLGAREVGFTVLSITVSLVAVFSPILLLGGIAGRLFFEFAMTLTLTILVSFVLALTTVPMLCALVLQVRPHGALPAPRSVGPIRRFTASLSSRLEIALAGLQEGYERSLSWALKHSLLVVLTLPLTIGLTVLLFNRMPKGFFPNEDVGLLIGTIRGEQSISFQNISGKLKQVEQVILADPDIDSVSGYTGGGDHGANTGMVFVQLKDIGLRHDSTDETIARLDRKLSHMTGADFFLRSAADVRAGGRQSNANYQYTLETDDSNLLYKWMPKLERALQHRPELTDVSSDVQQGGPATEVQIDRDTAAKLQVTPQLISNTLYDAFGQRSASVIYNALNQYHVVMEVAPRYWQSPDILSQIWVSTAGGTANGSTSSNTIRVASGSKTNGAGGAAGSSSTTSTGSSAGASSSSTTSTGTSSAGSTTSGAASGATATTGTQSTSAQSLANSISNSLANGRGTSNGSAVSSSAETMVPLSAVTRIVQSTTPLQISHQGNFVAATVSFNLAAGKSLSDAATIIADTMVAIRMPASIHGSFAGTAAQFQKTVSNEPLLILAALAAVYVTLGVLYESYIHPITILSTLPSAGVGAILALQLFGEEFSLIAMIGVILLIGIVKKNAILLVDFALSAERNEGLSPFDAIHKACLLRFRPIMMTTFAAALGALPLVFGHGYGNELRRPLGLSVVGGLVVSQALTLYTTPVVYLYLDRMRHWWARRWQRRRRRPLQDAPAE
ncbi:efflux RND transporter permease subunit [Lichenicoccus roseus]|uniref:Nodulation protein n=1 Tax=Lichenicoccus roseus TaxID=2683649 RepID=A0A5R9J928_9PROT|nr:efflux RND transporter permease subunit [Lichenicoccus roseus]TLU74120.1 nodulation protein [Lichenicoccus roseus]